MSAVHHGVGRCKKVPRVLVNFTAGGTLGSVGGWRAILDPFCPSPFYWRYDIVATLCGPLIVSSFDFKRNDGWRMVQRLFVYLIKFTILGITAAVVLFGYYDTFNGSLGLFLV